MWINRLWIVLLGMFGKGYPEGIGAETIQQAATAWHDYWLFPAGMAAVIFVAFAVLFWDRVQMDDEEEQTPQES